MRYLFNILCSARLCERYATDQRRAYRKIEKDAPPLCGTWVDKTFGMTKHAATPGRQTSYIPFRRTSNRRLTENGEKSVGVKEERRKSLFARNAGTPTRAAGTFVRNAAQCFLRKHER